MVKFENFLLTFCVPPHPHPLPLGERVGVRGNFKYFWLKFRYYLRFVIWDLEFKIQSQETGESKLFR